MQVLNTPEQINTFQLLSLKFALGLEIKGLKRSGKSANTVACQILGLPKGTKREITYAHLLQAIG